MACRERHDAEELRCMQLGGRVTFNYCRRANQGLPCKLIVVCWQGRVDAIAFLREHFTAAELRQTFAPPAGSKLDRLIELVERTKARLQPPTGEQG